MHVYYDIVSEGVSRGSYTKSFIPVDSCCSLVSSSSTSLTTGWRGMHLSVFGHLTLPASSQAYRRPRHPKNSNEKQTIQQMIKF